MAKNELYKNEKYTRLIAECSDEDKMMISSNTDEMKEFYADILTYKINKAILNAMKNPTTKTGQKKKKKRR